MAIPTLNTQHLLLKGITLEHALSYQKHFVDYEVIRHLSTAVPWPYPENGIIDFINNFILPKQDKNRWFWGLFLKSNSNELIGGIDLWRDGIPENRGFWLGKQFWNRGIMTEATTAVNDYAFDSLAFEKLIFSNALGNQASRRVKEKTGAKFIRTEPALFVDPQYTEREL